MTIVACWVPQDSWRRKRAMTSALSGYREGLPSLGEECLGVVGKRGEFQTHARRLGVQGLAGDHLGIDVREWGMPRWLQGEPNIGIGCDLPRNRGFGVVCPSETEQGARAGGRSSHIGL